TGRTPTGRGCTGTGLTSRTQATATGCHPSTRSTPGSGRTILQDASRCGTRMCSAPVADVTTCQERRESRDEDGWAASSRQCRTVTEGFEVSETPPIAELA